MSEEKKKSKVGIVILIIVIVLLVAGGAVAATFFFVNKDSNGDSRPAVQQDSKSGREIVVVNEDNVDEILAEFEGDLDDAEDGYYTVTMNPEWRFEDGKSNSDNAYVANAEVNKSSVYFDVIRNDTQETIYASPILTVGSSINKFALDTELEKGTYDCTCVYQILDENNEPISHLNVELTVVIRN